MENGDEGEVSTPPPPPPQQSSVADSVAEKPSKIFITDDEGIGDSENNTPRPGSSMAESHPPPPASSQSPSATTRSPDTETQSLSGTDSSDPEPQPTPDAQRSEPESQHPSEPQSSMSAVSQPQSDLQPQEPHPPSDFEQSGTSPQENSPPSPSPPDDCRSGQAENPLESSLQKPESADIDEEADVQIKAQINNDQQDNEEDVDGSSLSGKGDIFLEADVHTPEEFKTQDSANSGTSVAPQRNLETEDSSYIPGEQLSSQFSEDHVLPETATSNPDEPPHQMSENHVSDTMGSPDHKDSTSSRTSENNDSPKTGTSLAGEEPVSSHPPESHKMSSQVSEEPGSPQTLENQRTSSPPSPQTLENHRSSSPSSPQTLENQRTSSPASPQTLENHRTSSPTSPQTPENHRTISPPSPQILENQRTSSPTSPQTLENHRTSSPPSPQTLENHRTSSPPSPQTIEDHRTSSPPSPQTLENHRTNSPPSSQTLENHRTSSPPSPQTLENHRTSSPASPRSLEKRVSSQLQQVRAALQDYHRKLSARGSAPEADDDERLQKTLATVTAICQTCCSTSAALGKELQQARHLTDRINQGLTDKLQSTDLKGLLPLGYCMEDGETSPEERQAAERRRLARAAEARAAVARASHAMQMKAQELARAEAELMEAELAAAAAVEVAEEAVLQLKATKAAEEARQQQKTEEKEEKVDGEETTEQEGTEQNGKPDESSQHKVEDEETPEDKAQELQKEEEMKGEEEFQTEEEMNQADINSGEGELRQAEEEMKQNENINSGEDELQTEEGIKQSEAVKSEEQEMQTVDEEMNQNENIKPDETDAPISFPYPPGENGEQEGVTVQQEDTTEHTDDTDGKDADENLRLEDAKTDERTDIVDAPPEDQVDPQLTTQRVFHEVHVVHETDAEIPATDQGQSSENWQRFIYSVDAGDWDTGLGCVVRADSRQLGHDDLEVTRVLSARASLPLQDGEELVSNVLSLCPFAEQQQGAGYRFSPYLLVALPHCAPRHHPGKEVVVRVRPLDGGSWRDVEAHDVTFEDIREHKFVEARVREPGTLCVVLRLKREAVQITRHNGKFLASADSRVTMTWPTHAVSATANVTVTVQLLDQTIVSELRSRTDVDCGHLMSSSPIVHCHSQGPDLALLQPLVFTLPCPPNPAARPLRPATGVARKAERPPQEKGREEGGGDQRPATARPFFSSSTATKKTEEAAEDEVHVLCRQEGGVWSKLSDVQFLHSKKKDLVTFEMHDIVSRLMLLRTRSGLAHGAVERTASFLEHMLAHHPAHLVLRQHAHHPHQVVVTYTSPHHLDRTLRSLAEEGYSQGPAPSGDIRLREGQVLELSFRGNLKPADDCEFVPVCAFHAAIPFRAHFSVEEIDQFAQKGFSSYRGFVQFTTTYAAPFRRSNSSTAMVVNGEGGSSARPPLACFVTGKHLLAELLACLPKPDPQTPRPLTTAPVSLKSHGPVTNELLRHVAQQLAADDWRRLVPMLNIRRTRLQAILRQNMTTPPWLPIYDVLLTWSKRLPQSFDRVEMLCAALMAVGRNDLVEEVRDKDSSFRQSRAQSTRESLLNKAFVRIARHEKAVSQWRRLALFLGVGGDQVKAISERTCSARERCIQSLQQWKRLQDDSGEAVATVTMLAHKLRLCRYRALARDIESIR